MLISWLFLEYSRCFLRCLYIQALLVCLIMSWNVMSCNVIHVHHMRMHYYIDHTFLVYCVLVIVLHWSWLILPLGKFLQKISFKDIIKFHIAEPKGGLDTVKILEGLGESKYFPCMIEHHLHEILYTFATQAFPQKPYF